jgi:hypothetical protein
VRWGLGTARTCSAGAVTWGMIPDERSEEGRKTVVLDGLSGILYEMGSYQLVGWPPQLYLQAFRRISSLPVTVTGNVLPDIMRVYPCL